MVIKNAYVLTDDFSFSQCDIQISADRINAIGQDIAACDIYDASGLYAVPGFIDIHTHGCVGYDTCDGNQNGYAKMCDYYASNGVTSFLFTSMTLPEDLLARLFTGINEFCRSHKGGATPAGIYFEGPFINREKKGAQAGEYIIPPYYDTLKRLDCDSGSRIKVVAVAPEVEGALEFIKKTSQEYAITLAHTTADYDTAAAAAQAGASLVTHLYNGMSIPSHRAPGVPGAAFDNGMYVEIICDGIHLHPSVVRTTYKAAGADRVVLVSDSMQAAGMPDGMYSLGGQEVLVKDGKATLASGVIAGSSINLHKAMKNVVSWGIRLEDAVKAATINPAKVIGIDSDVGSIKAGKYADIVLLDRDLNIRDVLIRGNLFAN